MGRMLQGYFRRDRTSRPPSPPDTGAVIATALQLAGAMTYLHDQDIIHGAASDVIPVRPHW
jgi:hypothetical protein